MQNVSTLDLSACFGEFARIDADRSLVIHRVIVLLGDAPTYEIYEDARTKFGIEYRTRKPKADDGAVNNAWARFQTAVNEYAAENDFDFAWPAKPKSTSDAAVKKQAQRAVPEAVAQAQTAAQLDAIAKPADAVAAAKLEAAVSAKKLALIKAETKAAEAATKAALKARRDALIEYIKSADIAQLAELEAMREHNATIIIAALPLVDVQQATAKLVKMASAAPKSKAKV